MKSWEELYRIDIEEYENPDLYIQYKLKHKKLFIKLLKKYSKERKKLIEAGCGTGLVAGYMQALGYDVTAIDISKDILKLVEELCENSKIIQKSIFELDFSEKEYDVCFSNGVLEHFSDEQIIDTIKQQIRISNYVIIGVPSVYFDETEKMYGDERNIKEKRWIELIHLAGGSVIENTGFHYYPWYKRLLEVRKYFRPKAFHLFVVKGQ